MRSDRPQPKEPPLLTVYNVKGVLSISDSEAKKEWDKANTTRVVLKLNRNTDKDVLSRLDKVQSKQGYIKSLIRQDIANKEE